ncbi:pyridoxamine 5'-phosphate oxidase family protein [Clostridium tyrobutyricum]|uniref:pyridoxamine 5'-phosphate oxidase family protein n=1 Tax=Clostridium tyrobutyricum TaxID=1519 RepID=UPI001C3907D6|nr:pyridoxamine 5'-phosphate oxidase family protein [Clostridium tyrobutyricum]MBV4420602.1 pyridoxamine 5'-phosphate oxidase family protein [Clostridium tyrobutyricum]
MNEILKFLHDNHTFYLATVDGSMPKVRPFGFVMEYKGKLCFCTNNNKDVYKQLKLNSNFEISTVSRTFEWMRLKGKATFITTEESKRAVLDAMPSLRKIYSLDDLTFEVFCADEAEATFYNMKGETRTIKL